MLPKNSSVIVKTEVMQPLFKKWRRVY